METAERVARARVKKVAEVSPEYFCCGYLRELVRRHAGEVIHVYPERRIRQLITCGYCGAQSESLGVELVKAVDGKPYVGVRYIDIDEGAE